jgi:hypothetical protein
VPYVRQRTWIQMAPRIQFLRRGMGASCPSVSQLLGVADPNDPCQTANTPSGAPCPSAKQLQGIVDPTDPCQSSVGLPAPQPTLPANFSILGPAGSFLQTLQQYQTPILIGGGLLFGLVLLKGMRR